MSIGKAVRDLIEARGLRPAEVADRLCGILRGCTRGSRRLIPVGDPELDERVGGALDDEILSIILSNIRIADQRIGDIKAQAAALKEWAGGEANVRSRGPKGAASRSMIQPSGTCSPLFTATISLPSATVDVVTFAARSPKR